MLGDMYLCFSRHPDHLDLLHLKKQHLAKQCLPCAGLNLVLP